MTFPDVYRLVETIEQQEDRFASIYKEMVQMLEEDVANKMVEKQAEINRLKIELDQMEQEKEKAYEFAHVHDTSLELEQALAEVERLTKEVEKLTKPKAKQGRPPKDDGVKELAKELAGMQEG